MTTDLGKLLTFGILSVMTVSASAQAAVTSSQAESNLAASESVSSTRSDAIGNVEYEELTNTWSVNYFGVFFGPALSGNATYQPTPGGSPDLDRPLLLKNYMSVGYNFTEEWSLSGTAYWIWQPVLNQEVAVRDPYIRLANSMIINDGAGLNLYSDLRVHFPVSQPSRDADMLASFQTFHVLSYDIDRTSLGLYGSARAYMYGKRGYGSDLELYLGPNIEYRVSPSLAVTVLYEVGASHNFGAAPFDFVSDGTDIQPGVTWDVTPEMTLSPYLNIYPENVSWKSTSVGMTFYWRLI